LQPKVSDAEAIVPVCFNPTEYQLQKTNNFAEINIPGLESPPIQFVRGASEKLTADLLVDTSDTLDDVRDKYVTRLRALMNINIDLHGAADRKLMWAGQVFVGVVESLNITYTMFTPAGIPIRAKLALVLKEYRPAAVQVKERPTASPDFDKSWTGAPRRHPLGHCRRHLSGLQQMASDRRGERDHDPRRLQAGQMLSIPRLTKANGT